MEKKNPFVRFVREVLFPASFFFTICVFIFAFAASIGSAGNIVPGLAYMGLLYLFSVCIALLNLLFSTALSLVLTTVLHFAGSLIAFFIVFIIFGGYYKSGTSAIVLTIFFVLIYIIVYGAYMLIRSVTGRRKNSRADYKNQFRP